MCPLCLRARALGPQRGTDPRRRAGGARPTSRAPVHRREWARPSSRCRARGAPRCSLGLADGRSDPPPARRRRRTAGIAARRRGAAAPGWPVRRLLGLHEDGSPPARRPRGMANEPGDCRPCGARRVDSGGPNAGPVARGATGGSRGPKSFRSLLTEAARPRDRSPAWTCTDLEARNAPLTGFKEPLCRHGARRAPRPGVSNPPVPLTLSTRLASARKDGDPRTTSAFQTWIGTVWRRATPIPHRRDSVAAAWTSPQESAREQSGECQSHTLSAHWIAATNSPNLAGTAPGRAQTVDRCGRMLPPRRRGDDSDQARESPR